MPTLQEIRQQYPQYNDMSDQKLSDALYKKFYSDMPRADFEKKIGAAPTTTPYTGSILPFSKDEKGNVSFDSNAGILGSIKRALTLPGDVFTGKTAVSDTEGNVTPEIVQRSLELGTLISPISPASGAGERAIPGVSKNLVKQKPTAPSASELEAAAGAGYNAARNMGVEVRGSAIGGLAKNIKSALEQDGMIAELTPKTHAVLDKIAAPPKGATAGVGNIEAIRRSLQIAARDFTNPTEQLAASRAIRELDSFVKALDPKDIVAGGAPAARELSKTLGTARGNYAAAQRSNTLTGELDKATTGILERAEGRAQAANSGRNLDNTIRSKVQSILEKPKDVSGFSDAELQALNSVVQGGPVRNTARYVGNLLGGGGGLGQAVTTGIGAAGGAAAGGGIGAAVGAGAPLVAGALSKTLANSLAKRSLKSADEIVRMNSPLYAEMLRKAPLVPENLSRDAALAQLMLLSILGQGKRKDTIPQIGGL